MVENTYNVRKLLEVVGLSAFLLDIADVCVNGNPVVFYVVLDLAALTIVLVATGLNMEQDSCYLCHCTKSQMRTPGVSVEITKSMKDFPKSMLPQAFPLKYLIYDPTHGIANTVSLLMHATWAVIDDRSRKFLGLLLEGLYGFNICGKTLNSRYKGKKTKQFVWDKVRMPEKAAPAYTGECVQGRKTGMEWMLDGIKDVNKTIRNAAGETHTVENILGQVWVLVFGMICILYTQFPTEDDRQRYRRLGTRLQALWTTFLPISTFCPTTHHFCHHFADMLDLHGSLYPLLNEGTESTNKEFFDRWLDLTTQFMKNKFTGFSGLEEILRVQVAAWEVLRLGLVDCL